MGFESHLVRHKYAYTAFAKGAQMDFYIHKLNAMKDGTIFLECTLPRGKVLTNDSNKPVDPMTRRDHGLPSGLERMPGKEERLTHGQKLERERAYEEKKPYE